MLVKEMYEDCFLFDEISLAHLIHHLLTENKISLEDESSKIDLNQVDYQKVADMIKNNKLGIHKVGIYALKMNQKDFYFIFASSEEEAIHFYTKSFHQTPLNCHEYPLEFELTRGNDVISFRKMKKEFKSFPAIAGCFMRV